MGSLSPWRHRAARALWFEKAAIAYSEDALVPGRLQGGKDDKLSAARHLESVEIFQNTWPLHSCSPDANIGVYLLSGSAPQSRFHCFRYSCVCEHPDTEGLKFLMRRFCQSFWQSRKNPRPCLNQGDPQPGLVEDFQAIVSKR